jgi:hypothetical protein
VRVEQPPEGVAGHTGQQRDRRTQTRQSDRDIRGAAARMCLEAAAPLVDEVDERLAADGDHRAFLDRPIRRDPCRGRGSRHPPSDSFLLHQASSRPGISMFE